MVYQIKKKMKIKLLIMMEIHGGDHYRDGDGKQDGDNNGDYEDDNYNQKN